MSKLKQNIEALGLSYKSQIAFLIILNVALIGLGVAGYFLLGKVAISAFAIVAIVLFNYVYISRFSSMRKALEKEAANEFISLLSFFKTYLSNGYSVYQSFRELTYFTSGLLLSRIETLLNNIDNDKSIAPFIDFSRQFKSLQIEQLMICLYQMVDEGNNTIYLTQFEYIFSKIREDNLKETLERKVSSMSNCSVFPLIGSALLIVMITFGIVEIIGESMNGF